MDCDIVLLPSKDISDKAVTASGLFSRESVFTLADGKFYPHLSLYMVRLPEANLATVTDKLRLISTAFSSMNLRTTHYEQGRGYIVVDYETPPQLVTLQQMVLAAINPLRDGIVEKDRQNALEATGLSKENFEQYGYRYIGELFKPHITLTRFEDEQPHDESALPDLHTFDGAFMSIGLFELGISNTCARKLAEFSLAG